MSQDHRCRNESTYPPGQGPVTSSAAPDSGTFSIKGGLVKIHDCNTITACKVKRRKTKRDRNNAKFKSHTEIFKKKTFPRGVLQRHNMDGKIVFQSGMKDTGNSRQVFITENRLTQHQGIFNREIKSIDIGRLVNQVAEVDPTKTGTASSTVEANTKTPQIQGNLSLGLIPTPESKNQAVHYPPEIPSSISEPAPCNPRDQEIEKCQCCPQSDDNPNIIMTGSGTTTSPCRNEHTPILETADSIINMLNTQSLFPGRNLMSETRQALLKKVRQLHGTNSTTSAVPVQRKSDFNQKGNVHMYKDQGWECVGKGGVDISKTVPRTHRARHPIQNAPIQKAPIRFLPLPRDSPAHTLIKMVSQEEHLKLKDILPQPIHYGSDCNPSHQYQQMSSHRPPNMLNIHSSSLDPNLSRQDWKASSFCRVRKVGKVTSSPLNFSSPQVRWRLANDLPKDSSYARNNPPRNIRHILAPQVINQERESLRTPLEDISSERQNLPRVRMKESFLDDDNKTSDVFWRNRDQRSPTTKTFDISPSKIRLSYREQSPHRTYSASNFGSYHPVFPQMPDTCTHDSQDVFQLETVRELRETEGYKSSWEDGDLRPHGGTFETNMMPNRRHFHESSLNMWNPPSHLREKPDHRTHLENDGDIEWIHGKDWPHDRSHVEHYNPQRKIYLALSPPSVQQETPFPHGRSLRKGLINRSSPDAWVYPRMKLY
ncbi:proline-rich protein 19 [Rhinoderma darwinii]|uniref:proline-rich protein 19 n=1 Tax=Rhinoderma darwinii TaxID=43563 RepID=UPI003F67C2AA